MNWLLKNIFKDARKRKFQPSDKVRYFTEGRKGKGKGIVLTPSFSKGTVIDFDGDKRYYKIRDDNNNVVDVHPRNIIPEISNAPSIQTQITPTITEPFLR